METIIQIIQTISDNRFWLIPILLVGTLGVLITVFRDIFKNVMEEMDYYE